MAKSEEGKKKKKIKADQGETAEDEVKTIVDAGEEEEKKAKKKAKKSDKAVENGVETEEKGKKRKKKDEEAGDEGGDGEGKKKKKSKKGDDVSKNDDGTKEAQKDGGLSSKEKQEQKWSNVCEIAKPLVDVPLNKLVLKVVKAGKSACTRI